MKNLTGALLVIPKSRICYDLLQVVEGLLLPDADISYDAPPVAGLEQHLWVLEGAVEITADGQAHRLETGDCLRFRLWGGSRFRCLGATPARYALLPGAFLVTPKSGSRWKGRRT